MSSAATTRPTSSTVVCMARRMASPAPGPAVPSNCSADAANRAEHHPPFRPEAPKPTTSRSTTAILRVGSASAR